MAEVFRFVALGAPRSVDRSEYKCKVVEAYGRGDSQSDFHREMRHLRHQGRVAESINRAQAFAASNRFYADVENAIPPLSRLSDMLRDDKDSVSADAVRHEIHSLSGDGDNDIVASSAYQGGRESLADSLLAASIAPGTPTALRSQLMRGMRVIGLVEHATRHDQCVTSDSDVKDAMTKALVLLPADVFRNQDASLTEPLRGQVPRKKAVEPQSEEPSSGRLHEELGAIRRAVDDLRQTFHERVVSLTQQAFAVPQEDEVARLWELPTSMLNHLSSDVRATLRSADMEEGPLDVREAIARLKSRASRLRPHVHEGIVDLPSPGVYEISPPRPDEVHALAPGARLLRAPGIGHLELVRQELLGYEPGEIAHIENVLRGDVKERIHRRVTVREETTTREVERRNEHERDLQTADRFEMQTEASKMQQRESQWEASGNISASYGPTVSVTADTGFASSDASVETERRASQYARETTDRVVTRVQEAEREQHILRVLNKVDEKNRHGVDNKDGETHGVGIYQWVDKCYSMELVEYGLRLMLDFHVPEPAAFYIHAATSRSPEGITVERPDPPLDPFSQQPLKPQHLDEDNYLDLVEKYSVTGVSPPPPYLTTVNYAWEEGIQQWPASLPVKPALRATKAFPVPSGYQAVGVVAAVLKTGLATTNGWLAINGAPLEVGSGTGQVVSHTNALNSNPPLVATRDSLAIAAHFVDTVGFAISMVIVCERTSEAYDSWRLETYDAVMRAYFEAKSAYEEAVRAASAAVGIGIRGRSPLQNRATELTELKKGAISILSGQRFESFNSVFNGPVPGYPEINFTAARSEAEMISFFEQAFEWAQASYVLYPYFWGRKERWLRVGEMRDPDPQFVNFLQAGAARFVVPVRPEFQDAVLHYLATGEIWKGGPVPQIGDPLYVAIARELQDQSRPPDGTLLDSWTAKVPTALVILQKEGELPKPPPHPEP